MTGSEESVSSKWIPTEEEVVSMIRAGPSSCNTELAFPLKRARHGSNSSSSSSSNDYYYPGIPAAVISKGAVLQQNGHWGVRIPVPHQPIRLGSLMVQNAATMAYDSAAIFQRSGDARGNFQCPSIAMKEPDFQALYTPHAFPDGALCHELFQKELTPSDVGKLNRLVIPKKHAMSFFPCIRGLKGQQNGVDETELVFYDRGLQPWKFRYCYWSSSQSYVFARGWNLFVKEMQLKATDRIKFYACEFSEGFGTKKFFYMVDITRAGQSMLSEEEKPKVAWRDEQIGNGGRLKREQPEVEEKIVKLFGVKIN